MTTARVRRTVEVIAVGASLTLAASLAFGAVPTRSEWGAAAFFVTIGVLATSLGYRTSKSTLGSIAFLPFLTMALLTPTSAAVISVLVSSVIGELLVKREPLKAVFNVAQHVFAVALAIGVYLGLGGGGLLSSTPSVVPFVAMVATYFVVNKLAVSTVVAASSGESTKRHWARSMRSSAVNDVLAFPLIIFYALVYARFGAGWSAALTLPMLGLRQLYHSNFALQKVNEELLQLMVASIEARDPYTSGHSQRVARYARVIAEAAGWSEKAIDRTATAALLHDVGKIHEEFAAILRKPGKLSNEEFALMKTHPLRSAELVGRVSQFGDIVGAVRAHHESWDGRGYPDRLAGDGIPLAARVIALADTIDAMTTSRPYRRALTIDEVRQEITRERGRQFDPELSDRLLRDAGWASLTSEVAVANALYPATPSWEAEAQGGRTAEFSVPERDEHEGVR